MVDWDKRYLDMADYVAQWSKDPSTKVGAVIIDSLGRPVSFGYNGFARGANDSVDRLEDRSVKYSMTVHAEENAILSAGRDLSNCVLYVSHTPCEHCLSCARQSFIKDIVCYRGKGDFEERWNTKRVVDLAEELGINLTICLRTKQ